MAASAPTHVQGPPVHGIRIWFTGYGMACLAGGAVGGGLDAAVPPRLMLGLGDAILFYSLKASGEIDR
jgi:hypothetical protein